MGSALGSVACRERAAASSGPKKPAPIAVETYTVEPAPLVRTVDAVGSLRSPESTQVAAEIGGKIVYLNIPEGERVQKGHVLARLDGTTTRAEMAVAKARLQGAQTTLGRTQALSREKLIAEQAVDQAESDEEVAASEVHRYAASLQKTVITAPFTGVVGLRRVSLGAYVSPGTPITTLTSVDDLELVFPVPERYVAAVAVGQRVRGVVGACTHRFRGEVSVMEPAVDPATRTLFVLARVEKQPELKPGMSAAVRVDVEQVEGALSIPQEALIRRGMKTFVYVVKNGEPKATDVQVGAFDPREVEILSGLQPGDVVVAAGHQRIRPGVTVRSKPWEPVDNPNLSLGARPGKVDCWF